jgi:hypothetical protein
MGVAPVLLLAHAAATQLGPMPAPELSAGVSSVFYAHAFEFATGSSLDLTLTLPVARSYAWSAGARLGLDPVATEVFGRVVAVPQLGIWRPAVGVELGVTARGNFDSGPLSRREMRRPIEAEMKPYYLAIHASVLSFDLGKGWRIALGEFRVGSHLVPMGKFVRLEFGYFTLGHRL